MVEKDEVCFRVGLDRVISFFKPLIICIVVCRAVQKLFRHLDLGVRTCSAFDIANDQRAKTSLFEMTKVMYTK